MVVSRTRSVKVSDKVDSWPSEKALTRICTNKIALSVSHWVNYVGLVESAVYRVDCFGRGSGWKQDIPQVYPGSVLVGKAIGHIGRPSACGLDGHFEVSGRLHEDNIAAVLVPLKLAVVAGVEGWRNLDIWGEVKLHV